MKSKIKTLIFLATIVALALAPQIKAQSFITNGLAAYYPFTGNASDESGNGVFDTAFEVTLTTNRFGESNSAFSFPGVETNDAYIDLGRPPSLQFFDDFTVSAWVLFDGGGVNPRVLSNGQASGYELFTNGANPTGRTFGAWHANQFLFSNHYYPTKRWMFVALVKQGQTLQFFINGNTDGSIEITNTPSYDHNCQIGKKAEIDGHWGGLIDEVRFYSRALSATELNQLYAYNESFSLSLGARISLLRAVRPAWSDLLVGSKYQLQVSADMNIGTNSGVSFTATSATMSYRRYFDVANWNELFFRLQAVP